MVSNLRLVFSLGPKLNKKTIVTAIGVIYRAGKQMVMMSVIFLIVFTLFFFFMLKVDHQVKFFKISSFAEFCTVVFLILTKEREEG